MQYKEAKKRVEDLKGYYIHLTMYFSIILALFTIDYLTGEGWWFYWIAVFWGVGVVGHTAAMFFETGIWGKEWEERKLKEFMGQA